MNIRELRKEKGWSQGVLSDLTGLSVRTIHRIENGHGTPSVESAKALAAVFGLPFGDFLHPAKESSPSGQKAKEQQAGNATLTPEPVSTFAISWRGWVPYIAASFVAVSAYLINDLYSQIGQLSEDYSQLAVPQAQTPDFDVNWSDPYKQARTGVVAVIDEFTGYYGDQPIPSLLGEQSDVTSENASVTLAEVSILRFIARILSMPEGEPQRNSDVTIEFILDDFLSCYASQRQPTTLQFENENFDSMFSCIDEVTSAKGWVLADQQSDALNNLSRSVKEIERGTLRRMLGGSN
ncbi:MAG: helix-turn-helix transcriptional regulator, partial [Gammaproteobacteria bacterium]|nr:helix-turn-helix transcriptional regulator [Gammaproteobacteria bacterium]